MNQVGIAFEGISLDVEPRSFDEFHGISLCLIVMNEEKNLKEFFEWHKPYVDNIIVVDGGSIDKSMDIIAEYATEIKKIKFLGHYGNQKNRAIELSRNDWVLLMDPDERLSVSALTKLREMINQETYDCYSFPRKNTIDGVADNSHGSDHQARLFRAYCRYVRPTHEELVGFKKQNKFEFDSGNFIIHNKPGNRHIARNKLYGFFDVKYAHEIGSPGSQTKGNFIKSTGGVCNGIEFLKKRIEENKNK